MTDVITARRISTTDIVVSGSEAIREWRERNTHFVPGYEWAPSYQAGNWDGKWSPGKWCRLVGDTWEMRCSIGLLPRLQRDLNVDASGVPVGAVIELVADFCSVNAAHKIKLLEDYQRETLIAALTRGWGRAWLATNAGKGAVIGLLSAYGYMHNTNVLILCDELSVYDALLGEIKKWGQLRPRRLQAGVKTPPALTDRVVLAMVPTLAKRLESKTKAERQLWQAWVGSQHMVLCDEGDKALADTWKLILRAAQNSWWRIGFSGTFPTDPYDDIRFDELMGPTLVEVNNAQLIERGISARPTVELHGFNVTPALTGLRRQWRMSGAERRRQIFELAIVRNEARHAAIAALIQPNTPTVIIVNRVEHGKLLQRAIGRSVFLDGSAGMRERLKVLDRFAAGKFHVLIVTKILDRGTNRLGVAAAIIFASSEGSPTQTLQRVGRGLRRTGGKEFLRLIDIVDRVEVEPNDNGPLVEAAEYIHTGGRMRTQLYTDQGFDTEVLP